jgi:ABC-type Fe3+ transport system substrate-binding protein
VHKGHQGRAGRAAPGGPPPLPRDGATVVVEGTSVVQRAARSGWAKAWAILAGIATTGAVVLLATGVTDAGIAGFVVAVIAVVIGLIPLLHE